MKSLILLVVGMVVSLMFLTGCGGSGSGAKPLSGKKPFSLNAWRTNNTWQSISLLQEAKAVLNKSITLQTGIENAIQEVNLDGIMSVDYSGITRRLSETANNSGYAMWKSSDGGQFERADIIWIYVNNQYHLAVVLSAANHADDIYQTLNVWSPNFEGSGKMIGSSDVSTTMPSVRW